MRADEPQIANRPADCKPAAFKTHTPEEVGKLTDGQVRILWYGAHQWIADGRYAVKCGKEQLALVEVEMRRRGIGASE